jgi:hypothetical protein
VTEGQVAEQDVADDPPTLLGHQGQACVAGAGGRWWSSTGSAFFGDAAGRGRAAGRRAGGAGPAEPIGHRYRKPSNSSALNGGLTV